MLYRFCDKSKKRNDMSYFKQFEENLNCLKSQVENFNSRENDSRMANRGENNSTKKSLLKKMTEPKYYKIVAGMISENEKSLKNIKENEGKNTRYSLSPLKKSKLNINKNCGNFQQFIQSDSSLSEFLSQQLITSDKGKSLEMKKNILKKQKKLDKEWQKTENYRSQNHIYFVRKPFRAHKKEESIIQRVQMRRPITSVEMTDRSHEMIRTEPSSSLAA